MNTAVYVRVSTSAQDTRSQDRDLERWAIGQDEGVVWYRDKATGTKMERPGMERLLVDVRAGKVNRVVVWRLDRLGRTARGLLEFFDELDGRGVGFLSLKDAIDTGTPHGRLMRTILAGVAQWETEVRSERQRAGIAAVRAENGGRCPWGGRKAGTRVTLTAEKEGTIRELRAGGRSVAEIARVVGLGRQSVYRALGEWARKPAG